MKSNIKEYEAEKLNKILLQWGVEKYRVKQILDWVWRKKATSFDEMLNLPSVLRNKLKQAFLIKNGEIVKKLKSYDGTIKYLIKFENAYVESVFLPDIEDEKKATLCLSVQAGCPVGCEFCATGKLGFQRNLNASEIVEQVFIIEKDAGTKSWNIVLMGMGEPLLNYENVVKAIKFLGDEKYLNISYRKITLSTVGIAEKIIDMANNEKIKCRLSLSLHFTDDDIRKKYIPIAKKYSIKELIDACKYFSEKKKKYVTIEYILFSKLNTSKKDALKLAVLCKGWKSRVNLIPYNEIGHHRFKKPSKQEISGFSLLLRKKGINATIRKERGIDIMAACGQLSGKRKKSGSKI